MTIKKRHDLRKALIKMKDVFGEVPHWFIGSVVLGHVREKGFIKREHEIDYIIKHKDLNDLVKRLELLNDKILISSEAPKPKIVINNKDLTWSTNGEIVLRPIDNSQMIRVIKLFVDDVPVDIAIAHDIGDYTYYIVKGDEYRVNKFPKKLFSRMVIENFEGGKYSFPNKPLDYVSQVYGKDWNIVKHKWSCVIDPPCLIKEPEHTKIMEIIKNA